MKPVEGITIAGRKDLGSCYGVSFLRSFACIVEHKLGGDLLRTRVGTLYLTRESPPPRERDELRTPSRCSVASPAAVVFARKLCIRRAHLHFARESPENLAVVSTSVPSNILERSI